MDRDAAPDKQKSGPVKPTARKPYVKPAFEFDRAFETMALSCGKALHGATCQHVKKTS